ncbi:MAG TPA: phosphate acetyltransferase [Polyangiaceae bacterium]|nr:phosphate acetyltransferase [Polyangiaceae bacterium]
MARAFFLIPSGEGVGLTSVALGLVRALDNRGIRVAFFKPIGQHPQKDPKHERSTHFVRHTSSLNPPAPIPLAEADHLRSLGRSDELLERVLENYGNAARAADVVIVEGLVDTQESTGETEFNRDLVRALGAEVLLVAAERGAPSAEVEERLALTASRFGGFGPGRVVGSIINRVQTPPDDRVSWPSISVATRQDLARKAELNVIGMIPENPELMACRTIDIARHLGAEVLIEGDIMLRRVKHITLVARTVANSVEAMRAGTIVVTPGDRADVVLLAAMAAANGIPISGLVLTGPFEVPPQILELCRPAFATGLPVLRAGGNSWGTATSLAHMSSEIPMDDLERVQRAIDFVAEHVDADWLAKYSEVPREVRLSPAAFCHQLTDKARKANKRIVLPEGDEPRTVKAAAICAERGIAQCLLLADPEAVRRVAAAQEIVLPANLQIIDPKAIRANYVSPLVERRKHKGMTPAVAEETLEDNVWLGTMMLELGEVDGLVSGAVHSTANTIRPALQIIKTRPGAKIVSSVFFMCLPEQVVVYGDCAVVPDPDAPTLADIAIQSADSAAAFGLSPKVAMISYSTGESGSGSDVDKVREATKIAKALRPDLRLDGPLQYDAAAIPEVARSKAPTSPVAGQANVFVFPDLNTGNTTYKAVQRSAHVTSIGPMLQGMRRPVNDLSRGALVEDIVYTIALTAIQAVQSQGQG